MRILTHWYNKAIEDQTKSMKNITKLQIVCGKKFETAYQSIILHFEEHRSNLTWLKIKTMFLIFGFLDFPCKLKLFPMKIKVTNQIFIDFLAISTYSFSFWFWLVRSFLKMVLKDKFKNKTIILIIFIL